MFLYGYNVCMIVCVAILRVSLMLYSMHTQDRKCVMINVLLATTLYE